MGNLDLYSKIASVPEEAQKEIKGGKLNGFTDINPMWRIKTLTEQFGVVGFGWKYDIVDMWRDDSPLVNEVTINVRINLYVKMDGEWSEPIVGIGGSKFIAIEKGTPVMSDEAYKMALTDAISVACKALGMGADVYWDTEGRSKDKTKYTKDENKASTPKATAAPKENASWEDLTEDVPSKEQIAKLKEFGVTNYNGIASWKHKPIYELTHQDFDDAIALAEEKAKKKENAQ